MSSLCNLENVYQSKKNIPLVQKWKDKAWDLFKERELPNKKTAGFGYFPLKEFLERLNVHSFAKTETIVDIDKHIFSECAESCLIFVDGSFRADLSKVNGLEGSRLQILPWKEATKKFQTFLQNRWNNTLASQNLFGLLNSALFEDGLFIYAQPNAIVDTPIQILHIITQKGIYCPRVQIYAGEKSRLNIAQHTVFEEDIDGGIDLAYFDYAIDAKAHVNVVQSRINKLSQWQCENVRGTLQKDSSLQMTVVANGGHATHHDILLDLIGENSSATISIGNVLHGSRQAHTNIQINHHAPQCRSNQLIKNALFDISRSSFEGKIKIDSLAQQTNAFQLNNNLLLGEHARAYAKPNLEIFADDVKASHGATVGALDEEMLFYFRARGLSENMAKQFLLQGFLEDILERLPFSAVKDSLKNQIQG